MAKKAAPKAAEQKAAPAPAPASAPAEKSDKGKKGTSTRVKAATKGEIFTSLAEKSGLSKKEVAGVFDAMSEMIGVHLGKKGPGLFVIPGLLKLKVVRKEATKAKQGTNPFTKEPMTIKAKPARNVIKALPLKGLKDLV